MEDRSVLNCNIGHKLAHKFIAVHYCAASSPRQINFTKDMIIIYLQCNITLVAYGLIVIRLIRNFELSMFVWAAHRRTNVADNKLYEAVDCIDDDDEIEALFNRQTKQPLVNTLTHES